VKSHDGLKAPSSTLANGYSSHDSPSLGRGGSSPMSSNGGCRRHAFSVEGVCVCRSNGYALLDKRGWRTAGLVSSPGLCLATQSKKARSSMRTRRPTRRITASKPLAFAKKMRCRMPPGGGHACVSVHCLTVRRRVGEAGAVDNIRAAGTMVVSRDISRSVVQNGPLPILHPNHNVRLLIGPKVQWGTLAVCRHWLGSVATNRRCWWLRRSPGKDSAVHSHAGGATLKDPNARSFMSTSTCLTRDSLRCA